MTLSSLPLAGSHCMGRGGGGIVKEGTGKVKEVEALSSISV